MSLNLIDSDQNPSLAAAFAEFELDADVGFEHGLGLILTGLRQAPTTG